MLVRLDPPIGEVGTQTGVVVIGIGKIPAVNLTAMAGETIGPQTRHQVVLETDETVSLRMEMTRTGVKTEVEVVPTAGVPEATAVIGVTRGTMTTSPTTCPYR